MGGRYRRVVERAGMWLPLLTFPVYAMTARWRVPVYIDTYGAALESWTWASTGAPWLDNLPAALIAFDGPFPDWLFFDNGEHVTTNRTIGVVAVAVPFYWFSTSQFALWPSTLAAVVLATVAVALMHRALLGIVTPPLALAGALAFAFATPTWTAAANSLLTHGVTQLGIAGAAYGASRERWWWAGIALGIAITGRTHVAVIAAVVGLGVGWTRRSWRIPLAVGVPSTAGLAVVLLANDWRFGESSAAGGYSYAEGNLTATGASVWLEYLQNWAGFLISLDRGLLVWTPLMLVLAIPAMRATRTAPDWTVWLALGGVGYSLVQLKINHFTGADGFYGYRLGLELMTCLVPILTLGFLQLRHDWSRTLAVGTAWLQFAILFPGAVTFGLFVPMTQAWTVSALAVAVRDVPVATGLGLLAFVLGTFLSTRRLRLRQPSTGLGPTQNPEAARPPRPGRGS